MPAPLYACLMGVPGKRLQVVCGVFGFLALDSEKSDGEPGSASYRRLRDEAPDVALLMLGAGSPSGDPGKHSTVIHAGK